jgi:uncharacterized lipoprotein YajG
MRRFVLAAALLGLTACSNPVPSFIVAPTVFWNQSTQLSGVAFTLQVQDNRASNGTLIMRDGDKVNAYPTTNNLPQQIQDTLTQAMTAQGARITPGEPVIVTIQINQLEANANLKAVEHIVRNTVELTISIERESGSFNKPFSGRSTFSGPFKLDTAVAERELRILTEQVLASLLRDPSWQEFLRN